ncbi:hypothetical protein OH76DRAFT_611666 [Lentinus brumalis]|uniref:Uncharacterized protein n=1 Tax=Lentinus brumalis TaxID=2498619 RepID=A0A371DUT2_9APHY|nr:hypothetical protein OH76DRAFT_611666 [Polyporus brumalis]
MIGMIQLSPGRCRFLKRQTVCSRTRRERTTASVVYTHVAAPSGRGKRDDTRGTWSKASAVKEGMEAEAERSLRADAMAWRTSSSTASSIWAERRPTEREPAALSNTSSPRPPILQTLAIVFTPVPVRPLIGSLRNRSMSSLNNHAHVTPPREPPPPSRGRVLALVPTFPPFRHRRPSLISAS